MQFTEIGAGGPFTAAEFLAARQAAQDHMLYPPTTLVEVENTHNRGGGLVLDRRRSSSAVCAAAREHGIASYLDGARLWNAAVATRRRPGARSPRRSTSSPSRCRRASARRPARCVAGTRDVIAAAVRYRRMLGGAMRQAGILAAAGLYALEHHLDRLADDHANARADRRGARRDARTSALDLRRCRPTSSSSTSATARPTRATVVERARERGVLVAAFGPRTVRAVTHLDVTARRLRAPKA